MPIISANGESLSYGRGGGVAYLNGQAIGPGCIGPFPFITDDLNCGQLCGSGCALVSNAPGLPMLEGDGVSWPMAGGGRWMYQGTLARFYDSARGQIDGLYPLGVDDQGFGATYVYQAGSTVEITWPNGTSRALINVGVATQRGSNFRNGVLCFCETGVGWNLYGVNGAPWSATYKLNPAATQCVVVWINGQVWVFEQDNATVVTLRPADSTTAYIVSNGALAFNQDARQRLDGSVRVCWANNEGEPFGSVTDISLTLAQIQALPTIDITAPPMVIPPPATADVALPLPLVPFEACWVGCTDGKEVRPGSCEWSPSVADAPLNRPVGEGVNYAATVEGRDLLIAKYSTEAAAGGIPALDRTIAWARQRNVAVEIHVDSPAHRPMAMDARQRVLSAGLVPVLCAHAVINQSDFEADARAFAALGKWGITLNYRAQGKDPEAFKEVILRANQLQRELRPVVVWFASWANAGPQMKAYCAEVCRLTPTPVTRPHERSTVPQPPAPPWPNTSDPPVVKRPPARKSLPRWR